MWWIISFFLFLCISTWGWIFLLIINPGIALISIVVLLIGIYFGIGIYKIIKIIRGDIYLYLEDLSEKPQEFPEHSPID